MQIRRAELADLPRLPAIEHAAAQQFRASPYPQMADAPLSASHFDLARDWIWVALDDTGAPLAFLAAHAVEDTCYVHELDVHPAHARRGIGKQLLDVVAAWAHTEGFAALTLSTFQDVAWNGPYYARLGFRALGDDELTPGLRAIRDAESAAGLPVGTRACMRRAL